MNPARPRPWKTRQADKLANLWGASVMTIRLLAVRLVAPARVREARHRRQPGHP